MFTALDGGNVKGGILRAHLDWLKLHHPGALEALHDQVSPETRQILAGAILPSSWYPFRAVVETDRAIVALHGGDERETLILLGRHSARVNLTTSYKTFLKEQPHEFFRTAARLHRQFEDFGRAVYEERGPTEGRLSVLDCPCYAKAYCLGALGFFQEATAMQGGHAPTVSEAECYCEGGAACRFDIRWSPAPAPA
jgi:hypothetical protein